MYSFVHIFPIYFDIAGLSSLSSIIFFFYFY